MAVTLSFLLIFIILKGIHSITTVSEVSLKAGGSVSIPCLYESRYINNVKYLCKGYYWNSCSYAVQTNKQSSGKFSISDDKIQRIFTVTIKDLMEQDTGYYWCAVEINNEEDVKMYFYLSVTRDTPALYVDHQEIKGSVGEEITIKCYHPYGGAMKWCRLNGSCVTRLSGSIEGSTVTISWMVNVSTVTMSGLRTESSGWYLCDKGDFKMPVHLTVTEKPTTTHLTTLSPTPASEVPTALHEQPSSSSFLTSFVIRLSLLVLFVMVTSFILFMVKRHNQTKESSATTTEQQEEVRYTSDGAVTFNL